MHVIDESARNLKNFFTYLKKSSTICSRSGTYEYVIGQ